jgi:hypothetical protein
MRTHSNPAVPANMVTIILSAWVLLSAQGSETDWNRFPLTISSRARGMCETTNSAFNGWEASLKANDSLPLAGNLFAGTTRQGRAQAEHLSPASIDQLRAVGAMRQHVFSVASARRGIGLRLLHHCLTSFEFPIAASGCALSARSS